jgi:DNA-binding NarL/FixJ family response regulator
MMTEQIDNEVLPSFQDLKQMLIGKVLLVEDDPMSAKVITAKLTKFGLNCDWASTYEDAMKAFNAKHYHAVVTDIFLAGDREKEGGLQIVREVGKTGTPLVIITAGVDLEIAKEGLNNGASYLLEKPFEPAQLRTILERLWEEPRGLQMLLDRFMDINNLTPKEKEITRLLCKGLSNKEIAELTGNTEKTIKFHLSAIYEKSGVQKRSELFNAVFPT